MRARGSETVQRKARSQRPRLFTNRNYARTTKGENTMTIAASKQKLAVIISLIALLLSLLFGFGGYELTTHSGPFAPVHHSTDGGQDILSHYH